MMNACGLIAGHESKFLRQFNMRGSNGHPHVRPVAVVIIAAVFVVAVCPADSALAVASAGRSRPCRQRRLHTAAASASLAGI
jgi:hypothetical protein